MSLKSEINSAIALHSMWKSRLNRAISTGVFDVPLATIEKDSECYFGRWLYGDTISQGTRDSKEYQLVKEHHAEFHRVAARVAELALAGKKAEAAKLMDSNGEYTTVTTQLVLALEAWLDKAE